MDCKETLWKLFERTGNVEYYLLWKAIGNDDIDGRR